MEGLIGTKIGMTQLFTDQGQVVPVTALKAGPCTVVQVRTMDRDGYEAIQIGAGTKRDKTVSKAYVKHCAPAGRTFASLVEFHTDKASEYSVGQEIKLGDLFKNGDVVDVTGTTKGHGFAGVVKRYSFAGQTATHGSHESFRGPGSVGACAYPGRVFKGKRMPGHMGAKRRTTQNLKVVRIDEEENMIFIKGAIPGGKNGEVIVRKAIKAKKYGE